MDHINDYIFFCETQATALIMNKDERKTLSIYYDINFIPFSR